MFFFVCEEYLFLEREGQKDIGEERERDKRLKQGPHVAVFPQLQLAQVTGTRVHTWDAKGESRIPTQILSLWGSDSRGCVTTVPLLLALSHFRQTVALDKNYCKHSQQYYEVSQRSQWTSS